MSFVIAIVVLGYGALVVARTMGVTDGRGRIAVVSAFVLAELALLTWAVATGFDLAAGPILVAACVVGFGIDLVSRRHRTSAPGPGAAAAGQVRPPRPAARPPQISDQVVGAVGGAAAVFGTAMLVMAAMDEQAKGPLGDLLRSVDRWSDTGRLPVSDGAQGAAVGALAGASVLGGRPAVALVLAGLVLATGTGAWWLLARSIGWTSAASAGIGAALGGAVAALLVGPGLWPQVGVVVAGTVAVLVVLRQRADTRRPWRARRVRRRGQPWVRPPLEEVEWTGLRHMRRRPDRTAARWALLVIGAVAFTAAPLALVLVPTLVALVCWVGVRRSDPGGISGAGAVNGESSPAGPLGLPASGGPTGSEGRGPLVQPAPQRV